MSVACGLECVVCFGCTRWAWKRCTYIGAYDSENWPPATSDEFEPIPRVCGTILAVYETDLNNPKFAPPDAYKAKPQWVVKRVSYEETEKKSPPYLIYADREHKEIVLAIRGLNLVRDSDYKVLLDNRLGMQMFDGGFVHHGLLKAATWMLKREGETLRNLLDQLGHDYSLVFAGHSLGSGIAALMTIIVVNHLDEFGNIPRSQVRCYAVAPARCMSLNLAVKYADVINSVILQDDFLPRTPTPLEHIFGSIFCLPCLLFFTCLRDTFKQDKRKLRDPRRLYAPGRMYHIVERKFCRCGRFPPEVKTAIPVEGRFEHIVLSCNATSDHAILWIEREAKKALELMKQAGRSDTQQLEKRMSRKESLQQEHRIALEKAVTLQVPHAVDPDEEEPGVASTSGAKSGQTNWDDLVEKLFVKNSSGRLKLKKDIVVE
ncbi:alpha/beta-Hydrolases superfamily protein [Rhynchospora pubera]|uniref:Alpha/beta-Hydrolases superfamily protein n=1 Tax=Rhynchospora pubera TaxID=906938 RepID=A0AAV8FHI6_9POAL|nr:alpha/beta-Hydrolases superfamily protein [Rhynchospora pubera]